MLQTKEILDAALQLPDKERELLVDEIAARLKSAGKNRKVLLDLRSVSRGSYFLEIRRVGEDWDRHPVEIR